MQIDICDIRLVWPHLIIWEALSMFLFQALAFYTQGRIPGCLPLGTRFKEYQSAKVCDTLKWNAGQGTQRNLFHQEFSFHWCQSASSTIPPCLDLVVVNPGRFCAVEILFRSRGNYFLFSTFSMHRKKNHPTSSW